MLLVATAAPFSAARGSFAVEAALDVEGKAVVDVVVALPPTWARMRGCSKVWEELGSEAFTAKATLGAGGKALFPPLA